MVVNFSNLVLLLFGFGRSGFDYLFTVDERPPLARFLLYIIGEVSIECIDAFLGL
jgi:hypothetical protein